MKYDHVMNDMMGNLIKDQAEKKLEELKAEAAEKEIILNKL